jgi:hypothetical protein
VWNTLCLSIGQSFVVIIVDGGCLVFCILLCILVTKVLIIFFDLLVTFLGTGFGMSCRVAPSNPTISMSTNRPRWSVWGHGELKKLVIPDDTICCITFGEPKMKSMHWEPRVCRWILLRITY